MNKPTGIVERMKAAASLDEALKLTKEAEGYESISSKTERRFLRVRKLKIKEFKTKKK